ncbi:MAG: hypothetical protein KTR31_27600 [Myxococcales bacterium]|nr:hypothetical protein [Myxococcales bacterium]
MRSICSLLFFVGCSDGSMSTPDPGEPGVPTDGPQTTDTGWNPGDIANFYYDYRPATGSANLYAVAAESAPRFLNMAKCARGDAPCLPDVPQIEDECGPVATNLEVDQERLNTRFLGWEIEFAGYTLPFQQDPITGFGYYHRDISGLEQPVGSLNVEWGGQWPDYQGDQELTVGQPMELVGPRPGGHITFHNGQLVPFEWVPTGGVVTLNISTSSGIELMCRLEDDGFFELQADDLGIAAQTEEVTFAMTRWTHRQRIRFGHVVDYVASSDIRFTGEYFDIGNRDHLPAADRCSAAQGMPPLQSGRWWGDLGDYDSDLNPFRSGCLGGGFAAGFDALHLVEIPPKHLMQVAYNTYDDSAAVYLLSDCSDDGSCFLGADVDPAVNVTEFINTFNTSDETRRFTLVVDSSQQVDTYYTLDVDIDPLLEPDLYDTCGDAAKAPAIGIGNYYTDFTAYTNTLNPGVGGCTQSSLSGNEAMVPVELGSKETVTLNVRMPGGDPGIYLLYDCDNEFSCPTGRDDSLGDSETLSYTNTGKSPERLYIVVDSKSDLLPFFLSVNIF